MMLFRKYTILENVYLIKISKNLLIIIIDLIFQKLTKASFVKLRSRIPKSKILENLAFYSLSSNTKAVSNNNASKLKTNLR